MYITLCSNMDFFLCVALAKAVKSVALFLTSDFTRNLQNQKVKVKICVEMRI